MVQWVPVRNALLSLLVPVFLQAIAHVADEYLKSLEPPK